MHVNQPHAATGWEPACTSTGALPSHHLNPRKVLHTTCMHSPHENDGVADGNQQPAAWQGEGWRVGPGALVVVHRAWHGMAWHGMAWHGMAGQGGRAWCSDKNSTHPPLLLTVMNGSFVTIALQAWTRHGSGRALSSRFFGGCVCAPALRLLRHASPAPSRIPSGPSLGIPAHGIANQHHGGQWVELCRVATRNAPG